MNIFYFLCFFTYYIHYIYNSLYNQERRNQSYLYAVVCLLCQNINTRRRNIQILLNVVNNYARLACL
jgi:hypothetical protein